VLIALGSTSVIQYFGVYLPQELEYAEARI